MRTKPRQEEGFRNLDPKLITATCQRLSQRISERFPRAGLERVSRELVRKSEDACRLILWLEKPLLWPSVMVAFALLVTIVVVGMMGARIKWSIQAYSSVADLMQGFDAFVNELILLGVAIYFLSSLETRIKRRRALAALHELRSMAHIVDMHQLTKDPDRLLARGSATQSSPKREMTQYELSRYLSYSSELLSLISKIAALHVQGFADEVTLDTVNELEGLCSSVSGKIWQKILILDRG